MGRNCSNNKERASNGLPPVAKADSQRNYTLPRALHTRVRAIPRKRYLTNYEAVGSRSEITPLTRFHVYIYILLCLLFFGRNLNSNFEFQVYEISKLWISKILIIQDGRTKEWERERERPASACNFFLSFVFFPLSQNARASQFMQGWLVGRVGLITGRCLHFSGQRLSLYRRCNHSNFVAERLNF